MSLANDVTIIIPTYERPDYLSRANAYYADFECEVQIYDGSASANTMPFAANIHYHHVPDLTIGQRFALGSQECKTRYIVPMPDDDLISYQGLIECVSYLDNHADVASVNGQTVCFDVKNHQQVIMRIATGATYLEHIQRPITDNPQQSLQYALNPYHPFIWGVHRTASFRAFWDIGIEWIKNLELWENFFMWFMAVEGRLQMLPIFLIARQIDQVRKDDKNLTRKGLDSMLVQPNDTHHETLQIVDIIAEKMNHAWGSNLHSAQFYVYGLLVDYIVKDKIGLLRHPMDRLTSRERLTNRFLKWVDNFVGRNNLYYVSSVDSWGAVYFTEKRKFPVYEPRYMQDVKKMYDVIRQHPAY